MELRQLRYFVKTAETLNFSEASRQLFITQSTLSQQIRQLEEELGVELFQRDSHSVSLTECGQHLLPNAKRTLQDADSCFTKINDLKEMLSGELNIGITYSFAPILSEAVREFTRQYPGVKLNVFCRNMENLLEKLKRAEVDFVLCFTPAVLDSEIESHRLFDDQLCAIMKADHPLADREILSINDLVGQRIAMPDKETQARNAFDRCFPGADELLNSQIEITSVSILLDLVRENQMVTFLSEAALYQSDGLKAIPLDSPMTKMEGCIHALKKVYRKRAAEEFIKILSQSNAVMARANKWLK